MKQDRVTLEDVNRLIETVNHGNNALQASRDLINLLMQAANMTDEQKMEEKFQDFKKQVDEAANAVWPPLEAFYENNRYFVEKFNPEDLQKHQTPKEKENAFFSTLNTPG